MDFREIDTGPDNVIRAYGPEGIRVNEETHPGPLLVFRQAVWTERLPADVATLEARHLEILAGEGLEVVLIGSGDRVRFPEPAVTAPLYERGIGVEVMDTGAACRTFNLLASEQRAVAALLLPMDEDT